jgi:4-hydroxy-3-methylbut-2-enyl diphosphate reductase
MRVIRAEALGMCFGIREALEKVRALDPGVDTALYGELVHNAEVNRRLAAKGWTLLDEATRSPDVSAGRVVVTAHGISDRERRELQDRGKLLVDTTCPLVRRAHHAARAFAEAGWYVVVVGRRDHVEVKGLIGDLDRFCVVERPEDIREYTAERIGVLCQTTAPPMLLDRLWRMIVRANAGKEIRLIDTICHPTKARQRSVADLCRTGIQALVVVGGRNSNNTAQLAALAESLGVAAIRVESAADLREEPFEGMELVGLTAGTSTLDETVDAVEHGLRSLGSRRLVVRAS